MSFDKIYSEYSNCLKRLELEPCEHVLLADLGEKKLYHVQQGEIRGAYPVSSGSRTRSCLADSLGTPWGFHAVHSKHGEGQPPGMVFKGREATGIHYLDWEHRSKESGSLVTTRILRLRGLEPGLNAGPGRDSLDRYIYIHGTNHPDRFPENLSAGCLLMHDEDLLELFSKIPTGTHVWLSLPL